MNFVNTGTGGNVINTIGHDLQKILINTINLGSYVPNFTQTGASLFPWRVRMTTTTILTQRLAEFSRERPLAVTKLITN